MVITYNTKHIISYPVFKLPHDNWYFRDGLLFLDNQILDDTNMPGHSLGLRRVQTPHKEVFPLKRGIIDFVGIIKQQTNTFIDYRGRPFIYEKTMFCPLKYHKIKRVDKKGEASVIWFHGVNFPTTIPRPPRDGMVWGGFLYLNGFPWMLYDYSAEKLKDSRRKV